MVHFLQPFACMDPHFSSRSSLPPQGCVLPLRGNAAETLGLEPPEPVRDAAEPAPRRTPRAEEAERGAAASDLCVTCGLCCQGLLHRFVKVETDEGPLLHRLGLEVQSHEKHQVFELPCHHLGTEGCRVYSERPSTCRSYRCRLLEDFLGGDLDFVTARQRILRARELDSRLRRELAGSAPGRTLWQQIAESEKSLQSAERQMDLIELQAMCRRFFHKRDRTCNQQERPHPQAPVDAVDAAASANPKLRKATP